MQKEAQAQNDIAREDSQLCILIYLSWNLPSNQNTDGNKERGQALTQPLTIRHARLHLRRLATASMYEKYDSKHQLEGTSILHMCSVHGGQSNIKGEKALFFFQPADNQQESCCTEVKLHSTFSPLCSLSSLGPHDQSLFLLTELQTAWNQDEIGLQTGGNLYFYISLSPSCSSILPLDIKKRERERERWVQACSFFYCKEPNWFFGLFLAKFLSNLNLPLWVVFFFSP